MNKKILAAISVLVLVSSGAWAATYKVDPDHSTVSFKIKHLLSKVQGRFNKFEGTIDYEPGSPEVWKAAGTIDTSSIDTNNEPRDKHLRGPDFFDVGKYPAIEFRSTGLKDVSETTAKVEGILKMHGVEKPVALDAEILGVSNDPWGNVRAAFTASTKINRKDFGITWNEALETGGLLLGEDVDVTLDIEAIEQK